MNQLPQCTGETESQGLHAMPDLSDFFLALGVNVTQVPKGQCGVFNTSDFTAASEFKTQHNSLHCVLVFVGLVFCLKRTITNEHIYCLCLTSKSYLRKIIPCVIHFDSAQ